MGQAQNTVKNPWLAAEAEQAGGTTAGPATGGSAIQKQQPGKAEHKLYFYHPDHLGSTGYVTDEFGAVYQHLQYFPFGETWTEEASNTDRIPYLFTGKELDEETGLYYFGARYYDPRASLWVSDDPALNTGEYLPKWPSKMDEIEELLKNPASYWQNKLPGEGGVFNAKNLSGMIYGHHNPVRFSDPDGRNIENHSTRDVKVKAGDITYMLKPGESTNQIADKVNNMSPSERSVFLASRDAKGPQNIGDLKDADGTYINGGIVKLSDWTDGTITEGDNGKLQLCVELYPDAALNVGGGSKNFDKFTSENPNWNPDRIIKPGEELTISPSKSPIDKILDKLGL